MRYKLLGLLLSLAFILFLACCEKSDNLVITENLMQKAERYDAENNLLSSSVFTYDEKANLLSEEISFEQEKASITLAYDEKNRIKTRMQSGGHDSDPEKRTYEYWENGDRIVEKVYAGDTLAWKYEYIYEDGFLAKRKYDSENTSGTATFTYGKSENKIIQYGHASDGELQETVTYMFTDAGDLAEFEYQSKGFRQTRKFIYDGRRLSRIETYDEKNRMSEYTKCHYSAFMVLPEYRDRYNPILTEALLRRLKGWQ